VGTVVINSNLKNELKSFCRTNNIKKLSLFGSILDENFNNESDIDILVEFESAGTPGFFALMRMEEELSSLLGGRKVDLRTPHDLSRYFRDEVLDTAEVIYPES